MYKKINRIINTFIVACIVGAIFFGILFVINSTPTKETVQSLHSTKSSIEPVVPQSTPTPYSGPVTMTVAATATMKWESVLEPTDFVNVFQIVDPAHGFYASGEATYLIAHSYAKGYGAPGNAWEKLVVGNIVEYNGSFYEVNRVATPIKGTLASEPIWGNYGLDPNALYMITCESRGPDSPATNNYVISLERLDT
jgi:hypothetical protein